MTKRKTLLILGAANHQVSLILAAKNAGYRVVICDYTTDNPGLIYADKHYQVSTLDRDAVLEVANRESIDGVISNSEPAMPNVAYISEKLGLVGNSEQAVNILMSKASFRQLQQAGGLYAPRQLVSESLEEFFDAVENIGFPLIIKPAISSASRGNTTLRAYDREQLADAYEQCRKYSHDDRVVVEEYVEMPGLKMLEAEVFVCDGKYLIGAVFSDTHSPRAPKMPKLKQFPPDIEESKRQLIEAEVIKALKLAGITHGQYNAELYFTNSGELFIVEINPRQGGNKISHLIELHNGIDMTRLLVTTAVGDMEYFESVLKSEREANYITGNAVFAFETGRLRELCIEPEAGKYIIETIDRRRSGDHVEAVRFGSDLLSTIIMKFPSAELQREISSRLDELVYPIVDPEE